MKYLYLIIRHIFPRKKWKIAYQTEMVNRRNEIIGYLLIYEDQFGNTKQVKSYASEYF